MPAGHTRADQAHRDRPPTPAHVTPRALHGFCVRALRAVGATGSEAEIVATSLIDADVRGIDTHGIVRLPTYIARVRAGGIVTGAEPSVVRDQGSVIVLDGHAGFGQVAATAGMRLAIARASEHGIASAAVRNSNHLGALSYYSRMASEAGSIGLAVSGAASNIAPWGGAEARLGTNPWSVAFPAGVNAPLVIDVSNGVVLTGKIDEARHLGQQIPSDWALDAEGRPTQDPMAASSLLPFGGAKGAALTLAMEVFASVLTGAAYSRHVGDLSEIDRPQRLGHLFVVFNVDRFMPAGLFRDRLDDLVDSLRTSRPAIGHEPVRIPGARRASMMEERLSSGIPLGSGLERQLADLARSLRIEPSW